MPSLSEILALNTDGSGATECPCPKCTERRQREQRYANLPFEVKADDLCAKLREMQHPEQFRVGDVVVWRTGLKNCRFPAHHEPAIVTEVFAEPKITMVCGQPIQHETVVLGLIVNGDYEELAFDGRRFRRWTPGEEED